VLYYVYLKTIESICKIFTVHSGNWTIVLLMMWVQFCLHWESLLFFNILIDYLVSFLQIFSPLFELFFCSEPFSVQIIFLQRFNKIEDHQQSRIPYFLRLLHLIINKINPRIALISLKTIFWKLFALQSALT
jgi:hypothetical protein